MWDEGSEVRGGGTWCDGSGRMECDGMECDGRVGGGLGEQWGEEGR